MYKGLMIAAPSCAGKTFYVHSLNQKADEFTVFDGDGLISASIGWPTEKNWFRDPVLKEGIHQRQFDFFDYFLSTTRCVVLFNGDVNRLAGMIEAVVIPNVNDMVRNANKRLTEEPKRSFPATVSDVADNIIHILNFTQVHKVPVYETFEPAVKYGLSLLKQRGT